MLFMQAICLALALALASAGNNRPARMAMMAITTSSSIRVKAALRRFRQGHGRLRIIWHQPSNVGRHSGPIGRAPDVTLLLLLPLLLLEFALILRPLLRSCNA